MSLEKQPLWQIREQSLLLQRGNVAEEETHSYSELLDAMEKKAEEVGPFFVAIGEVTAEADRRALILFEPLAVEGSENKPTKLAVATASGMRCLNLQRLTDSNASELLQLLKTHMTIDGKDASVEKGGFSKETKSLKIDQLAHISIMLDPINPLAPVLKDAFVNSISFRSRMHERIEGEMKRAIQATASTRSLIEFIAEMNPPQTPTILS